MQSLKEQKRFTKFLESVGFTYSHSNRKGIDFYSHPGHPEVGVSASPSDNTVNFLIIAIQKRLGIPTLKENRKRDPARIKERQSSEREDAKAEDDRLAAERATIHAQILGMEARRFGGLVVHGSAEQISALRNRLIEIDKDRVFYQRLMTEIPASGRDRAAHRS